MNWNSLLIELAKNWREHLPEKSVSTDDRVTADSGVPDEPSRICYFAIPTTLILWYRDRIVPEVEASGLVPPVKARDLLSPTGTILAKLDTLVSRAAFVIAELGINRVSMRSSSPWRKAMGC